MEPNPNHNDNILDNIHATASAPEENDGPIQRRITLYRSGFTVDDGPLRRLDDPNNSEFLKSLARGLTPQELKDDANGGNAVVGLVDKRRMEYEEDRDRGGTAEMETNTGGGFQSFTGVGQSLGGLSSSEGGDATAHDGIISGSVAAAPPEFDESRPSTMIQIRLLNGKRLKVKVNCDSPASVLSQHINSSGDGGSEDYVLSSGYPPRILDNLSISVEEAGLKGAQVIQKKA